MKKIEAIIRPSKLKAVQKGLKDAGIPCITAVPVKGTGLQTLGKAKTQFSR